MRANNRFVVISTCFNVMPYVKTNLAIAASQNYDNFLWVYVDDKSTDGTYEYLDREINGGSDSRFVLLQNPNNGSQGKAHLYATDWLKSKNLLTAEDIIVEVDGDDWLINSYVLDLLNQHYLNPDVWMTYGQYVKWPMGDLGGHYRWRIDTLVDAQNSYRSHPFPYSHLKTYKAWLFNLIKPEDLIDPNTKQVYRYAWDHVLCLPMVEMSGASHIKMVEEVLYVLNRDPQLANEGSVNTQAQKQVESEIRSKTAYDRLRSRPV